MSNTRTHTSTNISASFLNPHSLAQLTADNDALLGEPIDVAKESLSRADAAHEALLDQLGPEAILELISVGVIPEEIAVRYKIRIRVLNKWLTANTTADELREAKKAAASLYRARAVRCVEEVKDRRDTLRAPDVQYLKLMSDTYTKMSEDMDPTEWNPRPSSGGEDAPLSVVFNIADPNAFGGVRTATVTGPVTPPEPEPTSAPSQDEPAPPTPETKPNQPTMPFPLEELLMYTGEETETETERADSSDV